MPPRCRRFSACCPSERELSVASPDRLDARCHAVLRIVDRSAGVPSSPPISQRKEVGTMSIKHGSHWLEREDFGGVTIVRLKTPKAPDEDTIRAVFEPIYSLVGEVGRNQLVLSLAAIEHLPSLAVGKLVMLNRKVQSTNG